FFRLKEPSSDRLESGRQPRRCARGYRLVCNRASSRQPGERRHLLAVLCLGRGFLRLFRIKKTPRLGGGVFSTREATNYPRHSVNSLRVGTSLFQNFRFSFLFGLNDAPAWTRLLE